MIQPGTPDQIPALKAIWAASFPEDPPEAIEDFFARCFRPEECLTAFEGGEPVSMVFLLPALYQRGGKAFPVQYIYAAATLPGLAGPGDFRRPSARGAGRGTAGAASSPPSSIRGSPPWPLITAVRLPCRVPGGR